MTQRKDTSTQVEGQEEQTSPNQSRVPDDPRMHPTETVEALEERVKRGLDSTQRETTSVGEELQQNLERDEMTDLPGPAVDELSEPPE